PLGVAFQLRDDVLGVFGDPAATGKPAGDDLREGKRTYLIATALEGSSALDRELLLKHLGDPKLDEDGVELMRAILVRSGGLARTEERIPTLTDSALKALSGTALDPGGAAMLLELAEASTQRHA